jgi:hypothetical protein
LLLTRRAELIEFLFQTEEKFRRAAVHEFLGDFIRALRSFAAASRACVRCSNCGERASYMRVFINY